LNHFINFAEVDVNIRQIPHLQKIVYKAPGTGENGSFQGRSYYRFGDVISLPGEDGEKEYWICVRPAFSVEGKEDSHWMSVGRRVNAVHIDNSEYYGIPEIPGLSF